MKGDSTTLDTLMHFLECVGVTPNLGVTKEIMSRGPQVADMECPEPDGQSIAPEGPSFFIDAFYTSPIVKHPPHWPGPRRKWVFLHEVMSLGIMVSVTLIFEAFEYVAKDIS
jgi:hypothetical protein